MTQKKTSQTSPLQRAAMGVKKPFFSKKCIFRAENDIFLKNSFYSKFISDQKYIICTFWKKKFFTKIMILYFSPNLTYIYPNDVRLSESQIAIVTQLANNLLQFIFYYPPFFSGALSDYVISYCISFYFHIFTYYYKCFPLT